MSQDPWMNRSEKMKCQTCMWFVLKAAPVGFLKTSPGGVVEQDMLPADGLGRCRKRAPTMDGYPVVFPTDWCGDHKLDETKL